MEAVCLARQEQVEFVAVADPQIEKPSDAVVAVDAAGLCGSDLHVYHGREKGIDPKTVLGHELVGTVVEVGPGVTRFQVGDRVAAPFTTSCGECFYCRSGLTCRCEQGELFGWRASGSGLHGCQAPLVRVPLADGTLVKMDPRISNAAALLLGDNLSTGFFCTDLAGVQASGTYVVVGCGTVGLLAVLAARFKGAQKVFAVDTIPHRLSVAEKLGATTLRPEDARDAVLEVSEGRGADAVMELVGLPPAQKLAFSLLRPGGVLATVGCHCTPDFAFSPVDAYDKNLTYRTGRCPARTYMERLMPLVASGRLPVDSFVTHSFALRDCSRAYEVFANRLDNCLKAMFVIEQ